MNHKKIWGYFLQGPLWLVMVGSFFASIYAAANNISEITYATSVFIAIVIILYVIGRILVEKKHAHQI